MKPTLAIIGTGIAGMGAAHHLQDKYELSIFEQNHYAGGHTNTIREDEDGKEILMDTGFMVFNRVTYPNLCKLFDEIKAPVMKTDMSFSVQHLPTGLEYCGSGLNGLFAQRKNIFNTRFIKMLVHINRFNKKSVELVEKSELENGTIKEFVKENKFSNDFLNKYLIPMSSAVWSTPIENMLDFPAATLIRFFKNHGFLGLNTQHQWYTLKGGSESYKKILLQPFQDKIRLNAKVQNVTRIGNQAEIALFKGEKFIFDKVLIAAHADQALNLLVNPTELEIKLLNPFRYQKNKATVHTDETVMPKTHKAWSSWNYRMEKLNGKIHASTIYWMNSLQKLNSRKNYFVSINAPLNSIRPQHLLREIEYEHPLFDMEAIRAQKDLHLLNRNTAVYFCGSYFQYGFHEDAYTSALDVCKVL